MIAKKTIFVSTQGIRNATPTFFVKIEIDQFEHLNKFSAW